MTSDQMPHLRPLQGRLVSVALSDGSRLDDGRLLSIGRAGQGTVWIDLNGIDVFIPWAEVIDIWEPATPMPCRRAS